MSTVLVEMLIFKCEDETGESWTLVEPEDIPSKLRDDPEVIEYLQSGCVAQFPGEATIYCGIKMGSGNAPPVNSKIQLLN